MTLRRVFATDDGQLLVTVTDGHVAVAIRKETWHSWGPPLPLDYSDDDKENA